MLKLLIFLSGIIRAQDNGLLRVANLNQCEGKGSSNYTYIATFSLDSNCTSTPVGNRYLIDLGQKTVNTLVRLAVSQYPNGGNFILLKHA